MDDKIYYRYYIRSQAHTSFTAQYSYSPIGIESVPNCNYCSVTTQIPVEQTIQYNDTTGILIVLLPGPTWKPVNARSQITHRVSCAARMSREAICENVRRCTA
jgi:hypothetical protein